LRLLTRLFRTYFQQVDHLVPPGHVVVDLFPDWAQVLNHSLRHTVFVLGRVQGGASYRKIGNQKLREVQ